jgi:hypothetical protein
MLIFYALETATIVCDPIKRVVPGHATEGFDGLARTQKLGQSWLAIDCAAYGRTAGVSIFSPRARHMRENSRSTSSGDP